MGVANNLGTGFKDFFYEPWEGLNGADGSLEGLLNGLNKGANSLVGHTVDGTSTALSKITGSLAQGFSTLTFDSHYRRQRARRKAQEAHNLADGLAQARRHVTHRQGGGEV